MTEPTSVRDESVMENIRDARENGYDLVCAECGCGITDESDPHDYRCSKFVETR